MPVVPGGAVDPAARLEMLLTNQTPAIRNAFLQAVSQIRDSQTIEQIADLIEAGNVEPFLEAIRPAAQIFGTSYGQVVTNSGVNTAQFLSNDALTNQVVFDRAEARVVSVLQDEQRRLITGFNQEQRTVIRDTLQDGFNRGINPRQQARQLREVVGLTPGQEQTVRNFRDLLTARQDGLPSRTALNRALRDRRFDRTIERALRTGNRLTETQIENMVSRYRQRLVNFHAETVARTEALSAVHQGSETMYQQAIDQGEMEPEQIIRTWVTARDERVRPSHMALNGQQRPAPGPTVVWQTARGSLRFPGDPQAPLAETARCRCVLTVRLLPPTEP